MNMKQIYFDQRMSNEKAVNELNTSKPHPRNLQLRGARLLHHEQQMHA